MKGRRPCEVCGARVANMNSRTTTCDPICTRAKHSGLSRELQIKRDIRFGGTDWEHPKRDSTFLIGKQAVPLLGTVIDYGHKKTKLIDGEEIE